MYEKVNPKHPDKIADRIAGAILDLSYERQDNPKVAVEVLIGHGQCLIINETSCHISTYEVENIVRRIADIDLEKEDIEINYKEVPQDVHLHNNQNNGFKCGDNGIFKGVPTSDEEHKLTNIAKEYYGKVNKDGKYIIDQDRIIVCQSNLKEDIGYASVFNPIGFWTGGINVDSGATNRKLGSDMGRSVTGGGLHGKDLSKADVSVNIYCYLMAQETGYDITCSCAIGDDLIEIYADGELFTKVDYNGIVELAKRYIGSIGGFEKFAEWGLIR